MNEELNRTDKLLDQSRIIFGTIKVSNNDSKGLIVIKPNNEPRILLQWYNGYGEKGEWLHELRVKVVEYSTDPCVVVSIKSHPFGEPTRRQGIYVFETLPLDVERTVLASRINHLYRRLVAATAALIITK